MYKELLIELQISYEGSSYEIWKQLQSKKNQQKALMSSQNSREENDAILQMLHAIQEAEAYYEKQKELDKKSDKLDGFDYRSLMGGSKKRKKQSTILSRPEDLGGNENLSMEERYDNIIGLMGTPNGFETGLEQLKALGEEGYVIAQTRLGDLYFDGEKSIEVDYEQARYWYEQAEQNGETRVYNRLGCIYMDHIKDREKAIYYLEKAVEAGDENANWNLGLLYECRFELKDYEKAAYYYEKSIEFGFTGAYNTLGCIYMDHIKDREKAIYWLEKAVEAGDEVAYWNLGLVFENRFEVKDYQKAIYWYEKALEYGDTRAYNKLGCIYMDHIKDREKAIYWLEKAVEAGDEIAYWNLGLAYECRFELKDYQKAIYWYEKALEYGDTRAYNKLGCIYMSHIKDREKAIYWLERAVEAGDEVAYWNLGLVYECRFEQKDYKKAYYNYRKAAEHGDTEALKELGLSLENGQLLISDFAKHDEWMERCKV